MTFSARHTAFAITPDFTSENGAIAQGVPTIAAGVTRALTIAFPSGEIGVEGARVRVQSKLMEEANKAFMHAKHAVNMLRNSNDSAAFKRAEAALARRALEAKQVRNRTLDAYGIALDENNQPYVMEERYPALLEQHAAGGAGRELRPVVSLSECREAGAAAA